MLLTKIPKNVVRCDQPFWAMWIFTLLLALSAHTIFSGDHNAEFSRTALGDIADEYQEIESPQTENTPGNIGSAIFIGPQLLLIILFVVSHHLFTPRTNSKTSSSSPRAPPTAI